MAEAVKCDRCGKFKEEKGTSSIELPKKIFYYTMIGKRRDVFLGNGLDNDKYLHICSDCAKLLEKAFDKAYKEWKKGDYND